VRLYWFWSFNPQKVRFALHELGVAHDLVAVDLLRGQQRHPDFVRLNPNARLPVLEDGDVVLWESNAIAAYLGEREGRLWPRDAAAKADALRWLFFEARHLSEPIGAIWFHDTVAPLAGIPQDAAGRERAAAELPSPLAVVEAQLARQPYLGGESLSLVDCCYGPVLDALSLSSFELAPYPSTLAWLTRLRERPAWRKCEFRSKETT
jgi:glutathione S-transferase